MAETILELHGITKIFPGVRALDQVQFDLRAGEIHALMGENGAGKSTFIKVIMGVHQAEEGQMLLYGQPVHFKSTRDAQKAGIAAIYQHVTAYPHLTVAENIFTGHLKKRFGIVQWKQMYEEADSLLKELNADFDSRALMGSLSVAQQQMVEIAKALSVHARIIIMDEPTAALTKRESEELYRITRKLRDEGVSIIFISHRFEDMYALASRVTVFRDSRYIGTYDVNGITNADLIKAMVGREINELFPKPKVELGEEVLRVEGLSRTGYFKDVSFHVRKGEILGLTGLVGARRTEVVQTIFGAEKLTAGKIFLEGQPVKIRRPAEAMKLGIGLLPENRQIEGLILDWGIGRNITLTELKSFVQGIFLNEKKENLVSKQLAEQVDTKAVTVFDKASSLSGGNQQKVVVAKALGSDFKVLILDEPTKGVDVGAKAAIYEIMGELAQAGYAIVMISSEMPEILGMCDRIVVMCEGRVSGELSREEATQEKILELAMLKQTATEGSV
ncbi:MAG: sugar ABC transporter ATP-binding protein [Oscillospiraceae bacterium]|nr:sugar ABC transporter ATP-binding protein [Oscillospiraceae bacterium]